VDTTSPIDSEPCNTLGHFATESDELMHQGTKNKE
jgi:hypothetical protein